jgi:copper homeostasis protein
MAIVSPASESAPLLEVTVLHARDAAAATAGEADRLLLVAEPEGGGRSPEPGVVSAVLRETDLPVRVMLRLDDVVTIDESRLPGLIMLARSFVELGAAGLSFGFLDRDNDVDVDTCLTVAEELGGVGWTFPRIFDSAFDPRRAWRDLVGLPGLDGVATAGSTRGLASGADDLLAQAVSSAAVAQLVLASGGLDSERVPWLIRAGVRQFGLTDEVRKDGSWTKASVDTAAVRAWRMLLDDAHQRALGVPVD